jgi:hypothetical protein
MSELSRSAQTLIQETERADNPSPQDRARIKSKLIHHLGAGAFLTGTAIGAGTASGASVGAAPAASAAASHGATATGAMGGAASAAATGGALSVTAKLAMATVLASAVGIGATVSMRTAPTPARSAAPATAVTRPAVAAASEIARSPRTDSAEQLEEPRQIPQPSASRHLYKESTPTRPRVTRSSGVPGGSHPQPPPSLESEIELIQEAQFALRRGENAQALSILASHSKRFPRGKLSEEREAARALALCELGRYNQGQAVAQRLLAKAPRSPLAGRIRVRCNLPNP